MLVWLSDRSRTATDFARNFLLNHAGAGNDINGNPKAYTASGLKNVLAGADAAAYVHVAVGDARVPDIFGVSQYGVVYTGGKGKIAEHGGANPQDRAVPLNRLRRRDRRRRGQRLDGRDDLDRAHDREAARVEPECTAGGADRAHTSPPAGRLDASFRRWPAWHLPAGRADPSRVADGLS